MIDTFRGHNIRPIGIIIDTGDIKQSQLQDL